MRFVLPNPLNSAAATILLTTLFSGYVSTMCVGGLRALLVALPLSFSLASLYVGLLLGIDQLERMVITVCTVLASPAGCLARRRSH